MPTDSAAAARHVAAQVQSGDVWHLALLGDTVTLCGRKYERTVPQGKVSIGCPACEKAARRG